ncbi:FecR family protein [Mucilaginibacter sp.]|uniref:FecR family protein n=1 Tax=Mucilaginibacter sp. TaxID=1882438 RepID=UPI00260B9928|nr:FecR family protein [Mucilaginibacter sp.]MDB4926130.1 FecR protein [Mucilaginibacter sp.]
MNKIQLSELLEKYANGTCTPEEMDAINQWYNKYQDTPDYTDTLPTNERELLKAKMQTAITAKIIPDEAAPVIVRTIYRKWWVGIAAAAIVLVLIKVVFLNNALKPDHAAQPVIANLQVTNNTKNILKQLLPDSSIVWLSPGASLNWPKSFLKASRNVAMKGDCFFEVTKNPNRPFIISSEHLVTKVWGTSFRVHDGTDNTMAKVTVLTGKVSVSKKGSAAANAGPKLIANEIILHPKDEVVLANNTAQLVATKQANVSDLALYKHFNLSFENSKLTEIVSVLNKKFEVNIRIRNEELDKAVMTADLNDLNLPEVLDVLKASMKLNYEISKDLIVLKKTN